MEIPILKDVPKAITIKRNKIYFLGLGLGPVLLFVTMRPPFFLITLRLLFFELFVGFLAFAMIIYFN